MLSDSQSYLAQVPSSVQVDHVKQQNIVVIENERPISVWTSRSNTPMVHSHTVSDSSNPPANPYVNTTPRQSAIPSNTLYGKAKREAPQTQTLFKS